MHSLLHSCYPDFSSIELLFITYLQLSCFPDSSIINSNNLYAFPAALLLPRFQQYRTLITYLQLSCFPDSSIINSNNLYAFPAALLLPRFQQYRTLITFLQLSCFPDFGSMDLISLLHVLCFS